VQLKLQNTLKYISNALLAALLLIATSSAFAEDTNSIDAVSGYVTVTSSNGDVKRSKPGDTLKEGDIITTGADSSASIILADGSVVNISELSSYTIGKDQGGKFAPRSLSTNSPTLSTATSAGGGVIDEVTPTTDEINNDEATPPAPAPTTGSNNDEDSAPVTPPVGGSPS